MNINYKQPQFELFPAHSATLEDIEKPKFLLAKLTLSIESLVILSILVIMIAIFAFSLGVERGKQVTAQAMDQRVAAAWNVGSRTVIVSQKITVPPRAVVSSKPVYHHPLLPLPTLVGTRFTLQLATYGNEGYARSDALLLRKKGFQSFLIKSRSYWLLCVGNFTHKENAAFFLRRLPSQYRDSQIRRY